MKDCTLTMRVTDDKVNFEGRDISMEELAAMAGFLQVFIGAEAVKRGTDLDDARDNLLDIHLTAMQELERLLKEDALDIYDE